MHRTHALRLTSILAVLLFVLLACPRPAAAQTRIMPLGDSITGSPGCWRALLWNQLQSTGFTNIDFVGTLPPQGCGVAYDGDNEGHGGFLATNVADQNLLPGWLSATRPDIVIMHFGTNDVWSARTPSQILAAFSKLVDQMRASNPSMKILVAQIIPVAPGGCGDCPRRTIEFNAAIPGWAASKSTTASPIVVVDQWTGFDPATDTSDGVHPNDAGIVKIANAWYPPLTQFLSSNGGGGNGVIANGTYRITPRDSPDKALDVAGHGTADNTNVLQWSYGGANNQRWTLTHLGNDEYQLIGVESGKALQVTSTSTANGTNVDIHTYTGAANQRWTITATSDGFYRLTPVSSSGSALEVSGDSTANGANVQQWGWTGGTNQQWMFQTP
ncbi:RICIN domain-containing protein [Archangium violaceum]|uniref:RICIN domain-containing protein n=1 Tax=Archangium violaceum TaxID=83451 RepID=UPI00193B821D|nr:RICIN domain-containing protein [Archangium violaceum]QRK07519.1 RICIN domain-containing protein [Archangium violaceum]